MKKIIFIELFLLMLSVELAGIFLTVVTVASAILLMAELKESLRD